MGATMGYKDFLRRLQIKFPTSLLFLTINLENFFRGTRTKIVRTSSKGIYLATDHNYKLYFCQPKRSILYSHGLTHRLLHLAEIYFLDNLKLNDRAIFLDCGANIGEVSVYVQDKFGASIIAIEPEKLEFDCLTRNITDNKATLFNGVVWDKKGVLTFYSKAHSADSSLIEFEKDLITFNVEATTVDELLKNYSDNTSIVLKIEAEGAEPEVIRGAFDSLPSVKYVVVDGSPERGYSRDRTEDLNDQLLINQFEFKKNQSNQRIQFYENPKLN